MNTSSAAQRAEWLYLADRAHTVADLGPSQRAYAIQLRQVLVRSLTQAAVRRALGDTTKTGTEWTGIAAACRREERRMERAYASIPASRGDS